VAVGYIDCGTFDCWTPPVLSRSRPEVIDGPAGSIAFVVAPSARRQGVAKAMIEALLARPELADLRIVGAGVEPENTASIAALTAAGFSRQVEEPDEEGMLYFIRRPPPAAGVGG
jgi:RimJ/RimL family protein N-acetyltransferase